MKYQEIEGNLITLAKKGEFDIISHGVNCFNNMGAGIAPQMAEAFGCDKFDLELTEYTDYTEDGLDYTVKTKNKGDINKLGQIEYEIKYLWFKHPMLKEGEFSMPMNHMTAGQENVKKLIVINSYIQYHPGRDLDYNALTLCMKKINHTFKGKHIGLPKIGAGLAGGDWDRIKQIIQTELKDMDVTIVIYKP